MPKALMLAADGFEDSELLALRFRVEEAGWSVEVAAPRSLIRGTHGYEVHSGLGFADADPARFGLLLVPGGAPDAGPAIVRSYRAARNAVRRFMAAGKPVVATGRGVLVLVSSDVLAGRRVTSLPARRIVEEVEAAGAAWIDRPLTTDGALVTAQGGSMAAVMGALAAILASQPRGPSGRRGKPGVAPVGAAGRDNPGRPLQVAVVPRAAPNSRRRGLAAPPRSTRSSHPRDRAPRSTSQSLATTVDLRRSPVVRAAVIRGPRPTLTGGYCSIIMED